MMFDPLYMGILLLVVLTIAWFEERENIVREKFLRRKMMRLLFRKYDDDYEFTAKHKKDFHKLGEFYALDFIERHIVVVRNKSVCAL